MSLMKVSHDESSGGVRAVDLNGPTRRVSETGIIAAVQLIGILNPPVRFEMTRMSPEKDLPDPSEPDLYWAGHSGFAMLPGVVVGALASAVVMLGLPPFGEWISLPEEWTAFLRFW